jgi:hypothetical protein
VALEDLVKAFADSVLAQSRALARNDFKSGNEFAKRYIHAFKQLRSRGDDGRNALSKLLNDDHAEVRTMAATFLLRHCEVRANAVLMAEAKGTGMVAFEAAQALQRWQDGTWSLDPK